MGNEERKSNGSRRRRGSPGQRSDRNERMELRTLRRTIVCRFNSRILKSKTDTAMAFREIFKSD